MKLLLRFAGFLFAAGTIVFLVGAAGVAGIMWHYSQDLPDYSQLQNYEPPVMTRVHAGDGALMAEYATQRRLYLPIQAVPRMVTDAFLAVEDKNFYEHHGIDPTAVFRAGMVFVENLGTNRRPQGASTITQQVAKNFLLTNEVSFTRKIKEALLAVRIENAYSKDKILELYLNEIYLGFGAYGIAAASLLYFDKSVHELNVAEAAYLAALPKAPSQLHPFRHRERAIERRNYVIDQMVVTGVLKPEEAEKWKKEPLAVTARPTGAHIYAADYFAEEVRRWIAERYGEKVLYEGGLSVRTTLDPNLQELMRRKFVEGLVRFDEAEGWRGPVTKLKPEGDWAVKLAEVKQFSDVKPWQLAVVLESGEDSARVGLYPAREPGGALTKDRPMGTVPLDGVRWAKAAAGPRRGRAPTTVSEVLSVGDVVYVEPLDKKQNTWRLRQVPELSGGMVAMDPNTGRVLAMVGGFSFDDSEFNRATQAMRQPGSSFKPFVYAAALDNGYTPSTVVLDAPVEIYQGPGQKPWRPENYSTGKYYGPQTLRFGLEHSRNIMTVRLAQDVGMPLITQYARRFGIYEDLPPYLSFSLGAGETTVLRMTAAYAMLDNGGRRITPTFIDRIQDRYGRTIYRHDQRECKGCNAERWKGQSEPSLVDRREQVIDPMTAYQVTSMMEGVVQRGTATVVRKVGKPIAGKTGTTNDERDVWFVGYSPDLVVGLYLGHDKPRRIRRGASGGGLAAPIVADFLTEALEDKPAVPFRVPAGIKLVRVNHRTGMRASAGGEGRVILEAFKPGTAPPDNYSVVGYQGGGYQQGGYPPEGGVPGQPQSPYMHAPGGVSPEADRAVGRGGLY